MGIEFRGARPQSVAEVDQGAISDQMEVGYEEESEEMQEIGPSDRKMKERQPSGSRGGHRVRGGDRLHPEARAEKVEEASQRNLMEKKT